MNFPRESSFKTRNLTKTAVLLLVFCLFGIRAGALDRTAFTFTHYDLNARVIPAARALEVRGRVLLRNDSAAPQQDVSLQISSTLAWSSVELHGKTLPYVAEPYTTDIDHTGAVSEAIVRLPSAVPPGGSIELQFEYAGTIPQDSTRLTRIGVPAAAAAASDWDHIGGAFTGVRGVGYVCWYPVAIEAASLSDGSRLFQALGEWKARHTASTMRLSLSVVSDKLVVTNGRLLSQTARAEDEGTVQRREYDFAPLGRIPPTFAIGDYRLLDRPAVNVFYLPGNEKAAQQYALAVEKDLPLLTTWFGAAREKVEVVDLPGDDAGFDSEAMLFSPLTGVLPDSAEVAVAHQIAHASIVSPRLWISEGLAHFAQAVVRERQQGRKAALAYMQRFRPALASAETQNMREAGAQSQNAGYPADAPNATPAKGGQAGAAGEPLIRAEDDIYYRGKAMFVWWMLRDLIGDDALQRAITSYHSAADKEPSYMQRLIEAQAKRRLEWFFDDWVYRDRGLPDFRIDSAYARKLLPKDYTIAITVENRGTAAAEVPVLVPIPYGDAQARVLVRPGEKVVTRVQTPDAPAEAIVNDGSVPESDVSNNHFKLRTQQ